MGIGATSSAVDQLRISTFGLPLPILAALRQELFESRALSVEYQQTAGSTQQIRQLLAGDVDIAHTAIDNVIAYVDEGEELVSFLVLELGIAQKLVVRPEVRSYGDLAGRALGVDSLSTGYAFVLRKMLARNGLSTGSYELTSIGGSAQRAQLLVDGGISGTLLAAPHDWPVAKTGCYILDEASKYLPLYPSLTAATTKKVAAECENALTRYVDAVAQGKRWAADPDNRRDAIDLIADARSIERQVAEHEYLAEIARAPVYDISQARSSIAVVRDLRREMTAGRGGRLPIDRYFDDCVMRTAGYTSQ
jgi:ABC-type nitrate/sulfonate/bicarbonate transport system substrate-binding protein